MELTLFFSLLWMQWVTLGPVLFPPPRLTYGWTWITKTYPWIELLRQIHWGLFLWIFNALRSRGRLPPAFLQLKVANSKSLKTCNQHFQVAVQKISIEEEESPLRWLEWERRVETVMAWMRISLVNVAGLWGLKYELKMRKKWGCIYRQSCSRRKRDKGECPPTCQGGWHLEWVNRSVWALVSQL